MIRKRKEHSDDYHPIAPLIHIRWNKFRPWDRHSLILMVAGIFYVLIGYNLGTSESIRVREITINIFPGNSMYIGFALVGAISMFSSRWPTRPRTLGYTVLSGWTASVGCVYLYGGFEFNDSAFKGTGCIWFVMAFLWWAISGLTSPPKERANSGLPSPHRDYFGGLDRRVGSLGDPKIGGESEPDGAIGIASRGDGERGLRAS